MKAAFQGNTSNEVSANIQSLATTNESISLILQAFRHAESLHLKWFPRWIPLCVRMNVSVRKSIARLKKSLMYKTQVVKSCRFSSKCRITTEIALGRESIRSRGHGFYSF